MYYPYLRGKQFELLALREFAEKYSDDCKVFPIIEPVKSSFNSMKIAIKKLQEKKINFALVLNPHVGELIRDTKLIEFELNQLLEDKDLWIPAYIVNNHSKGIIRQIQIKDYHNVMLICQESVDSNNPDFERVDRFACSY